jgi:hypothetical protein
MDSVEGFATNTHQQSQTIPEGGVDKSDDWSANEYDIVFSVRWPLPGQYTFLSSSSFARA